MICKQNKVWKQCSKCFAMNCFACRIHFVKSSSLFTLLESYFRTAFKVVILFFLLLLCEHLDFYASYWAPLSFISGIPTLLIQWSTSHRGKKANTWLHWNPLNTFFYQLSICAKLILNKNWHNPVSMLSWIVI